MIAATSVASYALAALIVVSGVLGYLRGPRRETFVTAGVLLAWGVVYFLGLQLVWLVDRIWLSVAFSFGGGFDVVDANSLLRDLKAQPLVDPGHPYALYAVLFACVVLASAWLGGRLANGPAEPAAAVVGAAMGMLNGYLAACALVIYVAPAFVGRGLAASTVALARFSTPALLLGAGVVLIAVVRGGRIRRSLPARSARVRTR